MVEAAGIEPASESTPPGSTTCLSRGLSSSGGSNTGTLPAGPSSTGSYLAPSKLHARPAHFFVGPDRRHGRGSGGPSRGRFRRPARAQRCRWLLLRCPFFIEVRASPACAPGFVALVETGSPPWRNLAPARGSVPAPPQCNRRGGPVKPRRQRRSRSRSGLRTSHDPDQRPIDRSPGSRRHGADPDRQAIRRASWRSSRSPPTASVKPHRLALRAKGPPRGWP
jgi:hypothetical protein